MKQKFPSQTAGRKAAELQEHDSQSQKAIHGVVNYGYGILL